MSLEKKIKNLFLAGLSCLIVGCADPAAKQMKGAVYLESTSNIGYKVYNISNNGLTNLERRNGWTREERTWDYCKKPIFKSNCYNYLNTIKDREYIEIVPKVTAKNNAIQYDMYVFINKTLKENEKEVMVGYGNNTSKKDAHIKMDKFMHVNDDIFAYHISWKSKIKKLDEQIIIFSKKSGNVWVNAIMPSSEIYDLIKN